MYENLEYTFILEILALTQYVMFICLSLLMYCIPLPVPFNWQGIEGSLKSRKLIGFMLKEKHTKVDEQGPKI